MLNKQSYPSKAQDIEWNCIKIPFIFSWFIWAKYSLFSSTSIADNKGLCLLFDCNVLLVHYIKWILVAMMFILAIFYVLEKKMMIVTFSLFLLSYFVFSLHESFGVSDRTGVVTLIWFVQFVAYAWANQNDASSLQKNRIHFPIQVIVACYTLSGLSKIVTSGFSWLHDGQLMVLQMIKSNQMQYLDGIIPVENILSSKIQFVMNHEVLIGILLTVALLIELTSGLGLLNKKMRLLYGFLLLGLHLGIDFFFGIVISAFYKSMIIFMINPFYLIYTLFIRIFPAKTKAQP